MYRKYLLKKSFWRSGAAYVRHDLNAGGIYAYEMNNGVKIVANDDVKFFSNFNDLDTYIDKLTVPSRSDNSQFLQVLSRRNTAKLLRKIPM
jgi:hypothetical protein